MSKYIDADLLRKEIKRRIEILKKAELDWSKQGDTETSLYYSGKSVALDEFADFIDSLQQEQPEMDLEEAAEKYRRASYNAAMKPNIDGPTPKYGGNIKTAFIAGAQWMENQFEHYGKVY